ncbi:MAG: transposase [Armatimonadetes bacterium]|nr:transposase [Armatimonadota bacterium]
MGYDPREHHRRSVRLAGYDYAAAAAHFVTVCTTDRAPVSGDVVDGVVRLSEQGEVAWGVWCKIPEHFPHADMDAFVVMPNHVHGIIVIGAAPGSVGATPESVGATHASPLPAADASRPSADPRGPAPGSLGAIVGSFKAATTRRINLMRQTPGALLWQRSYHEHIIRDEDGLARVRRYIEDNPLRWATDRDNPMARRP